MKILDIIVEAKAPQLDYKTIEALAQTWIKRNPDKASAIIEKTNNRYQANVMKIFNRVGIAIFVGQLNLNLYALEQIAKEPLETFQASDPAFASYTQADKEAYIKNSRDQIYGLFSVQILTPILIKWLSGPNGIFLVRWLFDALGTAAGAVAGPKGRFVATVIAKVATTAFLAWLASPAGAEWLADGVFMKLIRLGGSGVASVWDHIWPTLQDWTKLPIDKINPETTKDVEKTRERDSQPDLGNVMDPAEFEKQKQALKGGSFLGAFTGADRSQ